MELKGRILEIGEKREISEKFSVQSFRLDLTRFDSNTGEEYPNFGEFQVINGKIDLSKFQEADRVTVHFNVNGRFYEKDNEKKFAQTLNCWKIEKF